MKNSAVKILDKINYDYLNLSKELFLLLRTELTSRITKKKNLKKSNRILIVNPCLIGDFVASLPAIEFFIKKNKFSEVDLIVSPPIKTLAEKIIGIKKVFLAKSVYSRKIEDSKKTEKELKEYDLILIMRLSKESLDIIKKIPARKIQTSFIPYVKYALHLSKSIALKKRAKQWKEINFEMLGEKERNLRFEEIFHFEKKEYDRIKNLPEMKTEEKKVIIHTGSGWQVKLWENEKWIELLKKVNKLGKFRFIFIGTKKEKQDYEKIKKKLNFKTYSLIEKVDIKELMLVLRASDYFIGIDAGPRNMAHLADLRSVNLLGPGPKQFMPLDKRDIVIDKSNCRCTHLFCYKRKTCMQKINVNDVFEGFKKLIRNTNKK